MSSNISKEFGVGKIITYDQLLSVNLSTLRLEDIFVSECEDFWMSQIDLNSLSSDGALSEEFDGFTEVVVKPTSPSLGTMNCTASIIATKEPGSADISIAYDEFPMDIEEFGGYTQIAVDQSENVNKTSNDSNPSLGADPIYGRESVIETNDPSCGHILEDSQAIIHQSPNFLEVSIEETDEPLDGAENDKSSTTNNGLISVTDAPQDVVMLENNLVSKLPISINIHGSKGSCDNTKMFVRPASDGKAKKLCCPFCLKLYSKLARHLATMHRKDQEVKKFINLPKGSKDRRLIQDSIRKLGTHKWNGDVALNKNELIPSRRPRGFLVESAIKWTTCPFCLGSYTKTNLRHHASVCYKNPNKGQRQLKQLSTIVEGRIHENASIQLANVMGFMRQDEVVYTIRYDWLLIVYGNKLCAKYTPHYQHNMIRARLRLVGRLLIEIKKIDSNVTDFASIYHVERYISMVVAIKAIARFDPDTCEFGAPAMASFAVTFMKLIGKYLSAEYIRLRDRENKIETEDFLAYMDTDIDISINKLVTETQSKMRRLKELNIPTMDDVKTFIRFINVERTSCFEKLSKEYTDENWIKLSQYTMAWIIVFNRRRVGEVQNILVNDYLRRECIDDNSNEQIMSSLSEESKTIARKFKRMKIRGKKGRTVPVLLKPAIDKGIELLLSHRKTAGVFIGSQYLFELPTSSLIQIRVINACEILRRFSILSGALNPSSLRGTNLRKHMATTCVSLELSDAVVAEVAKFMGHAEKIHRDCYQQNTIEREVVQMSHLLEAAAGQCDEFSDDEDDDIGTENIGSEGHAAKGAETNGAGTNDFEANVRMDLADDGDLENLADGLHYENDRGRAATKKCSRTRWSFEEISCARKAFATHLRNRTAPTQSEIEKRLREDACAVLRSRTWEQIKAYINNQKKK